MRHVAAQQEQAVFEVWPENWPVLLLFLDLETQWQWMGGGMGRPMITGLNYAGVLAYFQLRGERPLYMDDLQAMERAALPVLNGLEDARD